MNDEPAGSLSHDALRRLSHELRTPINHILGYGEELLDEAQSRGATLLEAPLNDIVEAGRETLEIVNELLDPARADAAVAGYLLKESAVGALLDCIAERCARLQEQCVALGHDDLVPVVQKVDGAAGRLRTLIDQHPDYPLVVGGLGSGQIPDGTGGRPSSSSTSAANHATTSDVAAQGTILVVDDDQDNREILRRPLSRLGYNVRIAENGRRALEELAAPDIDLVLLDIMMPEMDGFEVLEHRRADARLRDIPFIMISALSDLKSVVRCIEMGAEDYLPKGSDPVLLRARIGACLEKKRLRDQEKAHLVTIERQAAELAEWNRTLEERVQRQVEELERVGRLRRFLSPQLAEAILTSGDEKILEPHRRLITVVFSDLRGYTAFTEKAQPEEIMQVLGEYHAAMGELIHRYLGTIEHFAGDGLMVFFNDPLEVEDAPMQATQMAVAMRERAAELGRTWRRRGHRLEFGVGIDMGWATCGRIGFEGRFDYGAIGTVTNLASRLCDAAGAGQILASECVYMAVEDAVEAELVGELTLKGFTSPVPAYNILGLLPAPPAG